MRFKLLVFLSTLLLVACQGNSQPAKVNFTPEEQTPTPEEPEPTPTPEEPEPTPTPEEPEPTPEPRVCITSHSATQPAIKQNSQADFVFFSGFSVNQLQSYDISAESKTATGATGFNNAAFPFQSISGNDLASLQSFNNGELLFESGNIIFTDTLTGETRQISNFDNGGAKVCAVSQIQPSLTRASEFYINYGWNCSLNSKVYLAMTDTDAAINIPNSAVAEGTAIYDAQVNWLGQLYTIIEQDKTKLVLIKPNFCDQNILFEFSDNNNSWSAEQFSDGSLLIRLEDQIHYLSAADVLDLVADESSFTWPEESFITLNSKTADILLEKNSDEIYYVQQVVDGSNETNNKLELYVYDIASKVTSAAISMYSGSDTLKTFTGLEKLILDDNSLWIESSFRTTVSDVEHYNRRYSRWDIQTKTLDAVAQFDYELRLESQESEWYSIKNKVYLKANNRTNLLSALSASGEKDYLLQANSAAVEVEQIWSFIKQGSGLNTLYDGVIALDYTNHEADQYTPVLYAADGSISTFPTIDRDIRLASMITQFDELTLFFDYSCISGCGEEDSVSQFDYRVSALKHNDSANAAKLLHHETCDSVNTDSTSLTCSLIK